MLPGVIYDKTQQPCLHGPMNGDSSQQQLCPLIYYSHVPSPGQVITDCLNRYVFQTDGITYHHRCPDKAPILGMINPGAYVIEIQPKCIMDSGVWMLQGLNVIEIKYTKKPPPPLVINRT